MKVQLVKEERRFGTAWVPPSHQPPLVLLRSLPFAMGLRGTYVHRVRSGEIIRPVWEWDPDRSWVNMRMWCGISFNSPRVMEEPPEGFVVCGTCEGRAIGAGQIQSQLLASYELKFSPRYGRERCDWECWSYYMAGGGSPHACRSVGKAVASRGDEHIVVCKRHVGSALRKGYEVADLVDDWRAR